MISCSAYIKECLIFLVTQFSFAKFFLELTQSELYIQWSDTVNVKTFQVKSFMDYLDKVFVFLAVYCIATMY